MTDHVLDIAERIGSKSEEVRLVIAMSRAVRKIEEMVHAQTVAECQLIATQAVIILGQPLREDAE